MKEATRVPCYYIAGAVALPELNGKAGRIFLHGEEDAATEFYEYLDRNVRWGVGSYFPRAFTENSRSEWDL